MLAPQSGQTRLRIAEIKVVLLFLNKAIMSLPVVVVFYHRMHRTLGVGTAGAYLGGRSLERSAAPRVR